MIQIIRRGIKAIPEDAKICPICGAQSDSVSFPDNPIIGAYGVVAEFYCGSCGTEWRYTPDGDEKDGD